MPIVLFEDNQCDRLRPVGLFRPLCELRVGSLTLLDVVRTLDPAASCLRREIFYPEDETPGIPPHREGPTLFLNASLAPDIRSRKIFEDFLAAGDPFLTTSGNRVSAALVPAGTKLGDDLSSNNISARLLELGLPLEDEMFRTIDWPHQVVDSHLRIFPSNLDHIISSGRYREIHQNVFVGENVDLASTAAFECAKGPVVIDDGVKVMHFTYLEGPIHIGAGTKVIEHSSIKQITSIGAGCKIGGEIEASLMEPHSNKQHHGFLGHSWVGRWVNLGAGTSTSDLKNTYGKVRVYYHGTRVDTGMQFLGSIVGDFSKSAVNTSFFTGKIVGVCSMLYGTVTTNVPCFTNYARSFGQVTEISLDQVITTQRRVFSRRDTAQTHYDVELLRRVFDLTRDERVMSEEPINF